MEHLAKSAAPAFRLPRLAAALAMAAWVLAGMAPQPSSAGPSNASEATHAVPQPASMDKAYCQYLFSVPDREPDAFEAGYAQAMAQATARIIHADSSISYFQALMRIRQECGRQMEAGVE